MSPFRSVLTCIVFGIALGLTLACSSPHGEPDKSSEVLPPNQVLDFNVLYAQNCSGCHGADGHGGASIALADPVYLAIADREAIRKAVAKGVPGTSMPAFADIEGGMLTGKQVDTIVDDIRKRWSKPGILDGTNPPPYAAQSPGNAQNGEAAYGKFCASCHGTSGQGGPKGSAITNDSFLALVSDQGLRTIVIVGRPELGAPDWRKNLPGQPMSDQEITDVVAWLASRRSKTPGQPYSVSYNVQH